MGPSQREGGEAELVITQTTADCSGRKQSWRAELRKCLTAYRSIPHSTTGRSPAKLLFNWKVRGKFPDLRIDHIYDQEVHDRDAEQKAKTKNYADTQRRASHSNIEIGDEVLVQQDKTNKLGTAFNPTSLQCCQQERKQSHDRKPNREAVFSRNTSHVKQYLNEPTPQNIGAQSETPCT